MNYNFNLEIAEKFGLGEAVFLENIAYWVFQNMANNTHFYDDRHWTYNSQKAFSTLFPFWTRQNLRRVIDSCKKHDLILTGNYNKIVYDRTNWYTLSDKGLALFGLIKGNSIGENQPRPWLESTKTWVETNPPIPLINTDNKQKIKDKIKAQPKKQVAMAAEPMVLPDWLPSETWEEFKQHRKQLKKPMSELAQKKSIKQLEKWRSEGQDVVEVIEASIANGWKGLFEIKSQGATHGKGNSNSGKGGKEKFDSWQYLYNSIRSDESKEDNHVSEDNLPIENSKHLWLT
jgi:hypothetical protein